MSTPKSAVIAERTVEEFRSTGLLFLINQILHAFGWVIVVELSDDPAVATRFYPARTVFRGFPEESQERGYANLAAAFGLPSGDELPEATLPVPSEPK